MKIQILNLVLIVLLALGLGYFIYSQNNDTKIAYIRSVYLVENYEGTKEAYADYQRKVMEWQANADTLKKSYQAQFASYKEGESSLSKMELERAQKKLLLERDKVQQYQQAIEIKSQEEDQKITEGLFKQIDAYVKEYAEQNGYDLIIGVGTDGNLLYGGESYDITEEVLDAINRNYNGK